MEWSLDDDVFQLLFVPPSNCGCRLKRFGPSVWSELEGSLLPSQGQLDAILWGLIVCVKTIWLGRG